MQWSRPFSFGGYGRLRGSDPTGRPSVTSDDMVAAVNQPAGTAEGGTMLTMIFHTIVFAQTLSDHADDREQCDRTAELALERGAAAKPPLPIWMP